MKAARSRQGGERGLDELTLDLADVARLDRYARLGNSGAELGDGDSEPGPVSPELVLVSPPELASLYREQLLEPEAFEEWLERVRSREPEPKPEPEPRLEPDPKPQPKPRAARAPSVLLLAAAAVVAPIAALLVAVYPSLSVLAVALALIAALAFRAPAYAVLLSLLLFGTEGSIKVGLAADLPPVGVTPDAVGAAAIDLGLGIALAGVLLHDRGRSLVAIWRAAGRGARTAFVLLLLWLAISVLDVPVGGSITPALHGFRLTQLYVFAAVAGVALFTRRRSDLIVRCLVGVLFLVSAYAALRGVVGPSAGERVQAMSRLTTPLVPGSPEVVFRNTGSFTSAIGLVSFLVPAGVFAFALGLLSPRYRLLCWFISAFAIVGILGSQVRAGVVALGVGIFCAVALLAARRGSSLRVKLALAAAPLALLGFGGVLLTISASGSAELQQRSSAVSDPFADASLQGRFATWKTQLRIVEAHPLGTGLGTVGRATATSTTFAVTADNSFVKILSEQGIPGGALFVLGVVGASIAAGRRFRDLGVRSRPLGVAALAGFVSFLVLALFSEAIEQPGKVLVWVLLGLCLWEAFGRRTEQERMTQSSLKLDGVDRRDTGREPLGGKPPRPPRWFRSVYLGVLVTVVVFGAIVFTLIRNDVFDSSGNISPTTPGNGAAATGNGLVRLNLVDNSSFESDLGTWSTPPAFTIAHSTARAHEGDGSLVSTRTRASSNDGNTGTTSLVFPTAGRYRAEAWVYLPTDYAGGPPAVYLEGYVGSRLLAQEIGDPRLRGQWQRVWSEYRLVSSGLAGSLVLRVIGTLPSIDRMLYWDDVAAPIVARNFVVNPGFETGLSSWADPASFAVQQSKDRAAAGDASMASVRDRKTPEDGNTGYTFLALPRAGTYRVEASVYLPEGYDGGPPAVYLESYQGSRILAERTGDPSRRGEWQRVWTDHKIAAGDLTGALVVRVNGSLPSLGKVIYWDGVLVTAPASRAAVATAPARRQSTWLAALLADEQVRLEVFLALGRDAYRPDRVRVTPSERDGVFSFSLGVSGRTPEEARRMVDALASGVENRSVSSGVERATAARQAAQTKLAAGEISSHRRSVLEHQVTNLTTFLSAPASAFLVGPGALHASSPSQPADRLVDALPGPFPPRPGALWAGTAALLTALGLLATAGVLTGARPRWFPAQA